MSGVIDPTQASQLSKVNWGEGPTISSPELVEGPSFKDQVVDFISDVNEQQKYAEQISNDYADGKQNDLHGTMIAMEEANITLRLLANVRNRALEAYREVMRMGS